MLVTVSLEHGTGLVVELIRPRSVQILAYTPKKGKDLGPIFSQQQKFIASHYLSDFRSFLQPGFTIGDTVPTIEGVSVKLQAKEVSSNCISSMSSFWFGLSVTQHLSPARKATSASYQAVSLTVAAIPRLSHEKSVNPLKDSNPGDEAHLVYWSISPDNHSEQILLHGRASLMFISLRCALSLYLVSSVFLIPCIQANGVLELDFV